MMPLVQAIHIVMIGIVFVSLLVICLRVLGRVRMDESLRRGVGAVRAVDVDRPCGDGRHRTGDDLR